MKVAVMYGGEVLLIDKDLLEERNVIVVETRFKVLIDGNIYIAYRHTDKSGLEEIEKIYKNLECNIYELDGKLVRED